MIGDEVVPAVSAVSAGEVAERRGVRAGWAWRVTAVGVGVGAVVGWLAAYWVNEPWWDLVVYRVLGLDAGSRLGSGVHFFVYDSVKILLLLVGIIFVVTVMRSFMRVEGTRAVLGGRREGVGNVMAAGLGVVTPFCSCSAVPAFIGFVAAGVPIGVTLSFLIASPLVNEVAIALLLGMFGPGIAGLYVGAGPARGAAVGGAVRVPDPPGWAGHRLHRRADIRAAGADGPGGGPFHPGPDLAVPAGGYRAGCGHPRLGAAGLLRPLCRGGQPARGTGRRRGRCPAPTPPG